MKRTEISALYKSPESFADQTITVAGWARSIRASNVFGFLTINDGSYFGNLQIVFDKDKLDNFAEVAAQNIGASFVVSGKFILTPDAKQPFEMQAEKIEIEGTSTPEYPLQNKKHSMEFLRTIAHLRPRANTFNAVFRVRSEAAYAIHSFFNERGFVYVHTPIVTASDCEGAGEMFRITTLDMENPPRTEDGKVDFSQDFFGRGANLTVSGQLNVECFAMAYSKVYTFGPTFRAEKSFTPRHAAEFWMMEPEIAFADLNDEMQLSEDMLKYVLKHLLKTCRPELEFFNKFIDNTLLERFENVINSDFARITYTDAMKLLAESGKKFEYPVGWGEDLQTEHERYLTEEYFKKPVFVTDWPREIKAFYMRLNDDGRTVAAADMLVPGVGELCGGSQREERMDYLLDALNRFGLDEDDYWWYLELRKYGGTKHAGFGLGFERLIMYVTGINNIRDVEAFPRTTGNADF
ncbi:MAG: asparagine--tRNA ligase [Clostridia bacterium]|nr:asparagine--tRNA ligase [Clostridia bacterium]